jgi:hypothetical protein
VVRQRAAAAGALATTTSQPCRVSSLIVAAFMPGSSTRCAHPVSSASRFRRSPSAGKTCGASNELAGGSDRGANSSIARTCRGISRANGRAIPAARTAIRNRPG